MFSYREYENFRIFNYSLKEVKLRIMKGEMFARILFLVVGVMFCFMWVVGGVSAVNPSEETYVSWTISSGGGWWGDTDDGVWRNGSNVIENNCSKYASVNNGFACCKDNIQCNSDGNCYGRVQYCWQYDKYQGLRIYHLRLIFKA